MSVLNTQPTISMIAKDYKTVGFYHKKKPYVIGFRNAQIARNIMYTMQTEDPHFSLVTCNPIPVLEEKAGVELMIDSEATVFIPKAQHSHLEENPYYIDSIDYEAFLAYPYTKKIGVILPYVLIDESEEEWIYRSHVIDPME